MTCFICFERRGLTILEIYNVTLNPSDMGTGNTLSNGNLTITNTLGNTSVRATHGRSGSRKWYFEVKIDSGNTSFLIGVANKSLPLQSNIVNNMNQRSYYIANGFKYPEAVAYGAVSVVGDVIGILVDLDNNNLEFKRNDISMGISHFDVKVLGEIYPFFSSGIGTSKTLTFNFGASPFKYSLPIGYNSYDGKQINSNKFLISSEDGAYQSLTTDYINPIPIMTSNTSPFGVVKSSDNNTSAWLAFNGAYKTSATDGWYYPNYVSPAWLSYEFSTPRKISRYTLSPIATVQAPKSWIFQGSNDGSNWVNLDSQTNVIFVDADLGIGKTYTFQNEITYKFYRIYITLNNGSITLSIDELKMFEKNYKLKLIPNYSETSFLNHGLNKLTGINLTDYVSNRDYIESSTTPLGSGKVFKQKIDTSKITIKKASIT